MHCTFIDQGNVIPTDRWSCVEIIISVGTVTRGTVTIVVGGDMSSGVMSLESVKS